jgi:hypothetical protein
MGKKIVVDVTELGRAGGHARAASLSDEELREASSKAARAKWDKYYREHPDKLKAKLAKGKKATK